MKKFAFVAAVVLMLALPTLVAAGGGFDQFGYNYGARLFVGKADGVDRNLDGTFWGRSDTCQ